MSVSSVSVQYAVAAVDNKLRSGRNADSRSAAAAAQTVIVLKSIGIEITLVRSQSVNTAVNKINGYLVRTVDVERIWPAVIVRVARSGNKNVHAVKINGAVAIDCYRVGSYTA